MPDAVRHIAPPGNTACPAERWCPPKCPPPFPRHPHHIAGKIYSAFVQCTDGNVSSDSLCIHSGFIGNSLDAAVTAIIAVYMVNRHNAPQDGIGVRLNGDNPALIFADFIIY